MPILFVALGVVAVLVAASAMKKKPATKASKAISAALFKSLSPKNVEILEFEEIIKFFKQSEILQILKSNANLMAVAIMDKKTDGHIVVACIFDKSKEQVADMQKATAWKAKALSDEVKAAFGDKDMIVLK
ncbi:MAG: hypothetical protein K6B43_00230 [Treponema sp.]|nr:hypothetical protein [Treponema sp.]